MVGEITAGSHGTPNQGGIEMGGGKGTRKSIGSGTGADAGDVVESPVKHSERRERSHDHPDDLDQKQLPLGDLHVEGSVTGNNNHGKW